MKTTAVLILLTFALLYAPAVHAVTFDWATVGNPGNADDTHGDGYGGVGYSYRISKTEVTNAQYTEFLNAVADADPNSLYSTSMGLATLGGITRSGSFPNHTYAVKPDSVGNGPGGADGADYTYGDKPVNYVSFFDAMRFSNWLENGQPTGAQGASTTEAGVYNIGSGTDEVRNPSATYFIPSEDEWYKAAYHKNDGVTGNYWDYPTSTNSVPNNNLPSADTGNSVNFRDNGVTTGDFNYPMTDVGAYALSDSPYGTFDQGGNVWEWNEAVFSSSARGIRGGGWGYDSSILLSSLRFNSFPSYGFYFIGFRVASIPEPTTATLALAALLFAFGRRRTR